MSGNKTSQKFWDTYWEKISLPSQIKKNENPYLDQILTVFDKYLPKNKNLSILEIGGSPGQYLSYMHNNFGYQINCLDYSKIGCQKTVENFELLKTNCQIYQADLFSENLNLPTFDIVYSLGFIEHFEDLDLVIKKHLDLLKPGGILLLGIPNFLGIYHFFLKTLGPNWLSKHVLKNMDLKKWEKFEKKFNLQPIFKKYVGGFYPERLKKWEKKSILSSIKFRLAKVLIFLFKYKRNFLKNIKSKNLSWYAIGIYRKNNPKP